MGQLGRGGLARGGLGGGGLGIGALGRGGGAAGRGQLLQDLGGPGNGGFFGGGGVGVAQRGGGFGGRGRAGRGAGGSARGEVPRGGRAEGRGREQQQAKINKNDNKPAGYARPAREPTELHWAEQRDDSADSTGRDQPTGDKFEYGGQPTAIPPVTNLRHLQPNELRAHMEHGGQTTYGERIRGVEGPSVYVGTEMPGRRNKGSERERGRHSSGSQRPAHPWLPETELYEQEKTRLKQR
ncbi:hypothetical protein N0V83_000564 [Neocucurbitaria cava]|uniref:Uncharacterized protein n=1 Tax=Neocucurbitaria cava TaxID=798079 RepID=A0A9W8YHI7_9PLEO|nr:hypothetical protein N0V83_000564 [Neocucurbitaria cava]